LPASLFLNCILFADRIKTQDAEKAGDAADFGESGIKLRGGFGHKIEEELIDPRSPMNRAAFDFHQIDGMTGKGLESGEERAGFVRETECDGHFQQRTGYK
jgi:hypothetical protein